MKTYLSSVKITFSELKKDRATDFPLLGLMISDIDTRTCPPERLSGGRVSTVFIFSY